MVSLVSPRDNLSMAQYHPRNPLDKSIVMHKGNQFFLIGNKKLEKNQLYCNIARRFHFVFGIPLYICHNATNDLGAVMTYIIFTYKLR